jgi:hypothetical protein
MRDLEFTWATFLARGMERGIVPEADPRLLTHALLGLYNSVFHWYRPRGTLSLAQVADFFTRRQLAVLGLAPELIDELPAAPRSASPSDGRPARPAAPARSAVRAGKALGARKGR